MSGVPTVLLTSDSPWQRALAHRIASAPGVTLAGLVIQSRPSNLRLPWIARSLLSRPGTVARKAVMRLRFGGEMSAIAREEVSAFGADGGPRPWPAVPRLDVEAISTPEVVAFVERADAGVVAVSGTSLIRDPVLSLAGSRLLLNLHTGISPHYKGGPNCTLWALSRAEPEYVGATLHVLDPGIDTGSIVVSAHTPLSGDMGLAQAVCATVELGHTLYVRVLSAVARGQELRPVPQDDLGVGRTFYTREWRAADMGRAVRFVRSGGLVRWVASGRPGLERVRTVDTLESTQP